ncbi:MAG: hypothetical protein A2Z35_02070 [Actinobacteria bacterium RBG_19FT_COMBO_36_27]|nr:MAG: hypothetical protein A2Z35_02070 [Actinobacteria bacterium RBG_19FT_COMBO_36_27]
MKNSKSRILIIMHGAGSGGVEQAIITLCRFLNKEFFEPFVVFPSDGPMKHALDNMGVKTIISPIEWFTPPKYLGSAERKEQFYYNKFLITLNERTKKLSEIIKGHNINIVHSSTLTIAEGAIAAKITGIPHIWHIHGKYAADYSFLPIRMVYSFIEDFSERIVAVSNSVKEFISKYTSEKEKIDVIYNGIDFERFNSENLYKTSLFTDYPCLKEKKIVSLIGRVYAVKGIDIYVDSAIKVLEKRNDVVFLIIGPIGDQELLNMMKKKIDNHNMSDKIIFTGFRDNIPSALNDIDLVVCASYSEGFPYIVLESMASSKPVISTKCGGPEEVVLDGETGYLVNTGDADELSKAILSMVDDEKKMITMGQAGKEYILNKFSANNYAKKFENIYANIINTYSYSPKEDIIWKEFILNSLSNLGNLAKRVSGLEHEVRDIKNFNSHFKGNMFYSMLRKVLRKN